MILIPLFLLVQPQTELAARVSENPAAQPISGGSDDAGQQEATDDPRADRQREQQPNCKQ
jgi:hypothetical protein